MTFVDALESEISLEPKATCSLLQLVTSCQRSKSFMETFVMETFSLRKSPQAAAQALLYGQSAFRKERRKLKVIP